MKYTVAEIDYVLQNIDIPTEAKLALHNLKARKIQAMIDTAVHLMDTNGGC